LALARDVVFLPLFAVAVKVLGEADRRADSAVGQVFHLSVRRFREPCFFYCLVQMVLCFTEFADRDAKLVGEFGWPESAKTFGHVSRRRR